GRDPRHASVAVTRGLLDKMDRTELEGVIAHELSHVGNRDIRVMLLVTILVGTVALLADWMWRSFFWTRGGRRERDGGGNAIIAAAVMLVVPVGAGAAVGVIARPTPSPTPPPSLLPTASPEPDTGPLVFQQPLSAGCATDEAVYVVSNGGGIGRFDGQRWQLIDSTLRSLVAAVCASDTVIAVGPAGRILTVDDRAK